MTSGSVWLVEAIVSSSCNKYVQYATVATVRDTNSCERLITCSRSIRDE